MKSKKILVVAASLLLVGGFVSCNNKSNDNSNKKIDESKAQEIINGYSSSVTGTVSLTYTANYKVDVQTTGSANLDSYKHQIQATTTADIDLTSGNLYLKVTKSSKDLLVSNDATKTEALVYSDGGTYYYVTTTMENPVALANEAAAYDRINSLLNKVSYDLAGYVDLDTLIYKDENVYQWKEFGLSSTAVEADWWDDPYYYGTASNGDLVIKSNAEYIGYKTDSGISDFKNPTEGKSAADIEIHANTKGYVTSYSETYNNASLEFPIMTPAPTVVITGERIFSATYGGSVTKVTTIDHSATYGTVSFASSNYGEYDVYTCDANNKDEKTFIESGAQVKVGDLLAVKVYPAGNNTIKSVTYNNESVEADADGYYYFDVAEGAKSLVVSFSGSDAVATAEWARVTNITKGTGVASVKVQYMIYPDTTTMYELDERNRAPIGSSYFLVITPTLEEGYELDAITVNGNNAANYGAWCYAIKTAGDYEISVSAKLPASSSTEALVNVTADAGVVSYELATMNFSSGTAALNTISNNTYTPVAGDFLCVKVTVTDGTEIVSVTVNGQDTSLQSGYYCISAATAGVYEVVITTSAVSTATVNVTMDSGVSSYVLKTMNFSSGSAVLTTIENNEYTPVAGDYLCIQPTLVGDANIVSVTVNGKETSLQSGFYCISAATVGTYNVVITTDAVAVANVNVTPDDGVDSYALVAYHSKANNTSTIENNTYTPVEGDMLCVAVTTKEGYSVSSVTINGKDAAYLSAFGYYYVASEGASAGTYEVVITTTANA